jgi:DNA-binding NtrC family response regulator
MPRENFKILVVDDEKSFLLLITKILEDDGYSIRGVSDPDDALEIFDSFSPNLVITDLKMPKMDGISLLKRVKEKNPETDVITITAFATVDTAVDAMKQGAVDYITKPLKDPEQLRIIVKKVYEKQMLAAENILLKAGLMRDIAPLNVVFAGMDSVLRDVRDVAETDATVMLYGETGTGKSLIAKIIHSLSGRNGPFVDINCAAIPDNLLESELFGYEKGAFTGALSQKKGKFEFAQDGTIFLDEISEMSGNLQAKLLRAIQEKTFERLGGNSIIKTNARIIAATNRNLKELVAEGKFREDLYYRLNVFPISLPSLRDRKTSIPLIAGHLLRSISARMGKHITRIDSETMNRLSAYSWPGNIRELENIIERAVIISKGETLQLPRLEESPAPANSLTHTVGDLKSVEMNAIKNALLQVGGNRKKTAESLGISLRALQYKIKEYGL